jgi:heat shock protein HslJ
MKLGLFSVLFSVSFGLVMAGNAVAVQPVIAPAELMAQMNQKPVPRSMRDTLANTEWLLEDLGGTGVVDRIQTTLRFDATNRISGQGGCNRYTGTVEFNAAQVKIGAVASTRKLCVPAVMDQETRYFQAIQNAERVELDGAYLLIHTRQTTAPLRFTQLTATQLPDQTVLAFEGRRNAVRIFRQGGQTLINVYDKQARRTWTKGAPITSRETPVGMEYKTLHGEATIVVFVPRSGATPTLTINGKMDR